MSILNCHVGPSRALVAVDTRGLTDMGKPAHLQKIMLLPHLNAAIAFRGHLLFALGTWTAIYTNAATLEELFDHAPIFLEKVRQKTSTRLQAEGFAGLDDFRDKQEVVLAGWSRREDQIRLCAYESKPGQNEFTARRLEEGQHYKAPFNPERPDDIPGMPCSTIDEMIALARKQKSMIERCFPGNVATPGGDLIIATIEPDRMTIATACNLDESTDAAPHS